MIARKQGSPRHITISFHDLMRSNEMHVNEAEKLRDLEIRNGRRRREIEPFVGEGNSRRNERIRHDARVSDVHGY